MIETISYSDLVENHCALNKKWAVMVFDNLDLDGEDIEDEKVWDALTQSLTESYGEVFADHYIVFEIMDENTFLFDTEEKAREFYRHFNKKPVYASGIYACLISSDGEAIDCNT
jgi:chromosome condensin MukBEF MukE localization factor